MMDADERRAAHAEAKARHYGGLEPADLKTVPRSEVRQMIRAAMAEQARGWQSFVANKIAAAMAELPHALTADEIKKIIRAELAEHDWNAKAFVERKITEHHDSEQMRPVTQRRPQRTSRRVAQGNLDRSRFVARRSRNREGSRWR